MTKPTCRELLDRLAPFGVEKECMCDQCVLAFRIEKVLATIYRTRGNFPLCIPDNSCFACMIERLLDGEER